MLSDKLFLIVIVILFGIGFAVAEHKRSKPLEPHPWTIPAT